MCFYVINPDPPIQPAPPATQFLRGNNNGVVHNITRGRSKQKQSDALRFKIASSCRRTLKCKALLAVLEKTVTTEKKRRLPKTDNLHPNPLLRLITKTDFVSYGYRIFTLSNPKPVYHFSMKLSNSLALIFFPAPVAYLNTYYTLNGIANRWTDIDQSLIQN